MGSEPIEEEIPPDMSDFPYEVRQAFDVYYRLPDRWDGMSGTYLGKEFSSIDVLFEIFWVDDRRTALDIISIIDVTRQEIFANKQKAKKEKSNGTKL